MIRYLTLGELVALHRAVVEATGGAMGVRDLAALESALAQPRATFGLYASAVEKGAALCFSIAMNHSFVDGNTRVGHAAMETFLMMLNGLELAADVDEQKRVMLDLSAGRRSREELLTWLQDHTRSRA